MVEKTQHGGFWPALYDPFRQVGTRVAEWFAPASGASVGENGYRIAVEVPGVAEQDLKVDVKDGVLTISGEKKSEREEKGDSWYFSERQYGSFTRSFRLPAEADPDAVNAKLNDGVLEISVGKKSVQAREEGTSVPITRN